MPLRTNEIEDFIKNMGFERGVKHCLCALAEERAAQQQQIMELAKMLDDAVSILLSMQQVSVAVTASVDRLRKMAGMDIDPDAPEMPMPKSN